MARIKNPGLTNPIVRHTIVLALMAGVVTFTACSDTAPTVVESSPDDAVASTRGTESAEVLTEVDQMPQLVGGINALAKSIVYPAEAKEDGVEGRVLVTFIVEKDGSVSNASVERGVDPRLDAAAVRAVDSIAFEPGSHEGAPARVRMTLPISFKLN